MAPTTAPTSAPDVINLGNDKENSSTTTAPVTTPEKDVTASGDTLTSTSTNGTAGVVPATVNADLKPVVSSADKITKSDTKTLPQTDEENGTALAVLGLSTLLMGSALFFGASKRRKHQA